MATSYTQEQVDAYEQMIAAAGTIESQTVGGQTFVFRPLDQMRRQLADMKRAVAASGESRTRYAATSKGLGS